MENAQAKLPSLYEITSDIQLLEEVLEQECTEESAEKLTEIYSLFQTKTDQCVFFNMIMEDHIEMISKRISELSALKKSIVNKQSRYETYVSNCLEKLGIKKVTGSLCSMTARTPSKVVDIIDIDKIPSEFISVEVVTTANKAEMAKVLREGKEILGVQLIDGKKSIKFAYGKGL